MGGGSFVQARRLCVLVCVWAGGEVGAPLGRLGPPVGYFAGRSGAVLLLWIVCGFFLSCVCSAFVRACSCALWSPARKRMTSWLSIVVPGCEFVIFPLVSWVMVVLDYIDS